MINIHLCAIIYMTIAIFKALVSEVIPANSAISARCSAVKFPSTDTFIPLCPYGAGIYYENDTGKEFNYYEY